MALVLSKLFMRQISQPHPEDSTGISLWTVDDIKKAQEKQRAQELEQERAAATVQKTTFDAPMDIDDEFGTGGLDDDVLREVDLDI